jgi:hypothetical protein
VVEVDPELSRQITSWCRVAVGYRWRDFEFHETTNRGHVEMHGPFVSVRFGTDGGPVRDGV